MEVYIIQFVNIISKRNIKNIFFILSSKIYSIFIKFILRFNIFFLYISILQLSILLIIINFSYFFLKLSRLSIISLSIIILFFGNIILKVSKLVVLYHRLWNLYEKIEISASFSIFQFDRKEIRSKQPLLKNRVSHSIVQISHSIMY